LVPQLLKKGPTGRVRLLRNQRDERVDLSRYGVAPLEDHFWRKAGELIARATQPLENSPKPKGPKGNKKRRKTSS
jgi:hypothetical protein